MGLANTISMLGGLGFFLFGMTLLGDGLKRVAGSKLKDILEKLTSTTFKGVLLGSLVTAVIQSSSATTVMVVGLVNSGIMKLANAVGIIMGANIGTTATGWILVLAGMEDSGGFSSSTVFAFIAFVGIILYFFCRNQAKKNVGMIMLAFSVLMNGMQSMSGAMAPLKESAAFLNFIAAVSNPFIAMVVGIIVTAIIQSCSASIGILQALTVTGVIRYEVAVPMVIGMCIGACVPVLLSAIGANVNGKRTALIYLYFNLAGAVVMMIPFYILNAVVGFDFMPTAATSMGVAIVNTAFKIGATMILMPFAGLLQKIVVTTIKDKKTDDDDDCEEDNLLDERFLAYPSLALEQCGKTIERMAAAAFKNFDRSVELFEKFSQEKCDKIMSREETVDRFEDRVGAYLVRLHEKQLSDSETRLSARYLTCLSNLERISDHAVNIAALAQELYDKKTEFSEEAKRECGICISAVRDIVELTHDAMDNNDVSTARKVEPLNETIDALIKELKVRHIHRVQSGGCTLQHGFIYNDILNNLERVANHCSNIAITVIENEDGKLMPHDYLRTVSEDCEDDYRKYLNYYAGKYYEELVKND